MPAPAVGSGAANINASVDGGGGVVLEDAAERLAAFKRRQAMELQHVLTFELRRLAQEVRRYWLQPRVRSCFRIRPLFIVGCVTCSSCMTLDGHIG